MDAGITCGDVAAERMADQGHGRKLALMNELREIVDKARHGIAAVLRPLAVAMPAQIGRDDMPAVAKPLHHPVPAARMVAAAMDQHQRRCVRIAPIEIMQTQALRNVGVRGRAWHGHFYRPPRHHRWRRDDPLEKSTRTPGCWYRAPRASGSVSLASGAAFGANLADGVVNDALQFAEIGLGVARLDVLNGTMKYAPADSFFDELREVALLHTLGAQKGAQGEVGFLRDLDVPADGFFHFDTHICG